MRRTSMPVAFVLAGLLGLLITAPASAAIDGTFCGQTRPLQRRQP